MQHVYIIGSKSIGQYGGFETFVKKLLEYHKENKRIKYHVACKANGDGYMDISKLPGAEMIGDHEFDYCNAHCFLVDIPEKLGAVQAIYYDIAAFSWCCDHIEKKHIQHPVVYILASRIGPFEKRFVERVHRSGGRVIQNPDGHENWRRKWNFFIRRYWKYSEALMIKNCDLAICDSINIEKYIREEYKRFHPKTTFIAYGSDVACSGLPDDDPHYIDWLQQYGLRDGQFYISVGRFVPENNFEVMIREFMKSKTKKDFVIITTEDPRFLNILDKKLHFRQDKRIRFVGTVYEQGLLKKIRENAYGYFHGHEVGGTNPSLLEALGSTRLNLLLNVGFNQEVAGEAALYWTKAAGDLARSIDEAEQMDPEKIEQYAAKARQRIVDAYSWTAIADRYEKIFLG